MLRTVARHLRNKHNNVFKNNEIKNNNAVASRLDNINIATMLSHTNEAYALRTSTNNAEEMTNSIQVFVLTTLHGKKHRINLCSKPVCNMKSEYLQSVLIECLEKSANSDFNIVPIILDGASINCKLMRSMLTLEKGNPKTPIPKMVFSTFFIRNNNKYFIMCCVMHIIKCMRNNLVKKIIISNIPN